MRKIILTLLFIPMISSANDEDSANAMLSLLATAKYSGMCGVFGQMSKFQQATKMNGGDEFVLRFLNTEAARLGLTLDEFFQSCVNANNKYEETVRLFKSDAETP